MLLLVQADTLSVLDRVSEKDKAEIENTMRADVLETAHESIQAVRPAMRVFEVSSKTGAGMPEWLEFMQSKFVDRRV